MIDIKKLSFGYGKENLFSELDLSLGSGSICGLLGKNGAGKTTLLKLIAGLLFPREGDAVIMKNIPSRRSTEFLQDLYFLPEEFSLPDVTPGQYAKLYAPFYPAFNDERYEHYLDEFGLGRDINLKKYTYGQKKKFLITFGLSSGCRLMLLDEPTNGLDIPSKTQFRKAIASVITENNAIIISTHQVRDLETLIDPVIILDQGKIIFNQSMEDISNRLKVTHQTSPPDPGKTLFSEKTFEGYTVVTENHDQENSHMDMETLFNTVISNSVGISRIFEDGGVK